MANSANPDLRGMMSYIWVVARIEDLFRMDWTVIFYRIKLERKEKGREREGKAKKARSVGHSQQHPRNKLRPRCILQ